MFVHCVVRRIFGEIVLVNASLSKEPSEMEMLSREEMREKSVSRTSMSVEKFDIRADREGFVKV